MPLPAALQKPFFHKRKIFTLPRNLKVIAIALLLISAASMSAFAYYQQYQATIQLQLQHEMSEQKLLQTESALAQVQAELTELSNEDQFKKNTTLETEIAAIQKVFKEAVGSYENLLQLKEDPIKTQTFESLFAKSLTLLAQRNYTSASQELAKLQQEIQKRRQELATVSATAALTNVQAITEAPDSGYRRQSVQTSIGTFVVDIIAADLNTTRVQVETASDGDCRDNCPVASLADYVGRSGGFAGINGPYFCPAEYPSCAGKTNSFDTLLMNKKKTYFNSDNNVYSVVPIGIFTGNSSRFLGATQDWGRDTGVDAVIAAQPMVLSGGNVAFGGDGDPKKGSRGNRSFIGGKDNKVFIGVVRGATVAEVGHVLKAMGLHNALNLDSGGSTALMANGKYVAGPGRATPFGIVLVRK